MPEAMLALREFSQGNIGRSSYILLWGAFLADRR